MRVVSILLASAFLSSAAFAGTDTFRGDLAHSGVYSGAAPASEPPLKWKFHTDGYVIGSPAIDAGIIFVGSADGNVYAVDRASGQQRWVFKTTSRVVSSAAVSNGVVYIESYDGYLYAIDEASGTQKWKFATKGEKRFSAPNLHGIQPVTEVMPDPFDHYLSSPAVWNGAVYFGSGDGNIYAVDATTGALKWKFKTGNVVHASPALADGTVFVGSWDSYFYALDAKTGREKWRFKTGSDPKIHNQEGIQSSAAVADGVVYFGCRDSHLYAVDAKTGKQRWAYSTGTSWVISSPAVRDAVVYAATSDTAKFFALDAKTGAEKFVVQFNHWPFFSSPSLAGNFAYIGSQSGKLVAIDLDKRAQAWDFATDGQKQNGAALSKPDGSPNYDAAFTDDFYDTLMAGHATMMKDGMVLSSPVIADGTVYFGSADGNLYAIGG